LCDYKGATITIAKIKNEETLIGGYNPFDWKPYTSHIYLNRTWQKTTDSFLFSFVSKSSKTGKIARVTVTNSTYAVSHVKDHGPSFGSGWDFAIVDDSIQYYEHSCYSENNFLSRNRCLEDYEVFQVIKK